MKKPTQTPPKAVSVLTTQKLKTITGGHGKPGVHHGVHEPADRDHRPAPDAIGPAACRHRHAGLHDVQRRPHQRHEAHGPGRVGEPQQQERVGGVAEREQREDQHEVRKGARERIRLERGIRL